MSESQKIERSDTASIFQCGAPRGDHAGWCDLQNDHGGNMHSGLVDDRRVWWDRKGRSVSFGGSDTDTYVHQEKQQ